MRRAIRHMSYLRVTLPAHPAWQTWGPPLPPIRVDVDESYLRAQLEAMAVEDGQIVFTVMRHPDEEECPRNH